MKYFLPLFLIAMAAPAQVVSFGITAGVPVTPAVPGNFYSNPYLDTGRWTVGPDVDFHLVSGLSFEVGMLLRGYRIVRSDVISPGVSGTILDSYRTDAKDFDFPLLLKYRFLSGARRPFIDAGYVVTHESLDNSAAPSFISAGPGAVLAVDLPPSGPAKLSQVLNGGAIGIGEEFKYRKFRIAPEVRFTVLNHNFGTTAQRQLSALVGFTF
jgi:hypothetical protein